MSQSFQYSPLEGNEIRQLCIDTIDGHDKNHGITLRHYGLEDVPAYLALSYTWEDPSLTRSNVTEAGESVQVNGEYFGVGLNLGAALRALRVQAPLFLEVHPGVIPSPATHPGAPRAPKLCCCLAWLFLALLSCLP
jgi:hypothetical protein